MNLLGEIQIFEYVITLSFMSDDSKLLVAFVLSLLRFLFGFLLLPSLVAKYGYLKSSFLFKQLLNSFSE